MCTMLFLASAALPLLLRLRLLLARVEAVVSFSQALLAVMVWMSGTFFIYLSWWDQRRCSEGCFRGWTVCLSLCVSCLWFCYDQSVLGRSLFPSDLRMGRAHLRRKLQESGRNISSCSTYSYFVSGGAGCHCRRYSSAFVWRLLAGLSIFSTCLSFPSRLSSELNNN